LQAALCGAAFFVLLLLSLRLMGVALEHYLRETGRRLILRIFSGRTMAFAIGFSLCWLLQSSSVTVSLILPLVAHSALTLPMVYHYSIGAAVATTCDAGQMVCYLIFGPIGLASGLVHIYMNLFGAVIFLLVPGVRQLPLLITQDLAGLIANRRHGPVLLVVYAGSVFFGIPIAVIAALRALGLG
jgi:sodium-dependent phosphate cotransporter